MQQRCTASDSHAAQLHEQLKELQNDKILLGARLHDGSLDMVKGQLIQQLQQQVADSSQVARAFGEQSQQAAQQIQSLQDQLALQQQAQFSERERLSMEAAQSRLLCKARARQVTSLELQCKAEVSGHMCFLQMHSTQCSASTRLCAEASQAATTQVCFDYAHAAKKASALCMTDMYGYPGLHFMTSTAERH